MLTVAEVVEASQRDRLGGIVVMMYSSAFQPGVQPAAQVSHPVWGEGVPVPDQVVQHDALLLLSDAAEALQPV